MRRRDANPERAGEDSQHEPGGDQEHVEDRNVLQAEAVGDVERDIAAGDRRRGARDARGEREARHREHGGERECGAGADRAARHRPVALARVSPIGIAIDHVVQRVHRARHETERGEDEDRLQGQGGIGPAVTEEPADEHEAVLDPLVRPPESNPMG